ncbi:MAG: hypothetical protein BGO26_14290 [Actinobacteria bacterium 69-20]|jgi:predicted HicB family RNase H-like nuclease|nr:CopG family transcriptional regulator [Actinomycetota bacterium]OJV29494.1 MAG: hypothetical protein BGO26_14290 [Actinobacteria bacterium 69-20]
MTTKKYRLSGPDIPDEEVVLPSGRRLTEQVRQEIIEDTRVAARSGRPSLSRSGRHSPQIGVRLSENDHAAMKRAASKLGISASEFARRAITAELKRVS